MDDLILPQPHQPGGWGEPLPSIALGGQFSEAPPAMGAVWGGVFREAPPGEPEGRLPPGTLELTHLF